MTKTEFTATLAKKNRRPQSHYTDVLDDILLELTEQLVAGQSIRLTGFGTFRTTLKKERTQRDIRTGNTITIPTHRSVYFQAGEVLKRSVRTPDSRKSK